MPSFPKPKFPFAYDVAAEVQHLRAHKATRLIPDKTAKTLLIATWDITHFGAQERTGRDRRWVVEIPVPLRRRGIQEVSVRTQVNRAKSEQPARRLARFSRAGMS